jgi:hypothetical protein
MTAAIEAHPNLPFKEARCEQRSGKSNKRRDITVLDKDRKPVVVHFERSTA